jgi:hypothetical protein
MTLKTGRDGANGDELVCLFAPSAVNFSDVTADGIAGSLCDIGAYTRCALASLRDGVLTAMLLLSIPGWWAGTGSR